MIITILEVLLFTAVGCASAIAIAATLKVIADMWRKS